MIQPKQIVQKLANSFGYQVSKLSDQENSQPLEYPFLDVLNLVVQDYLQRHQEIFFIQIGAHDGSSADLFNKLVKKYCWRGILVEPQPEAFKKLVENYQTDERLIFENSVISRQDGTATFYSVREQVPPLPPLLHQAASLDRDKVYSALSFWKKVKHHPGIPEDFASLIEETPLPAITIKSLMAKHQVQTLDLLMVDAMGYDFQILKLFPFDQVKPAIIQFEHSQLSSTDREACLSYLADQGYSLAKFAGDTVAYQQEPAFRWAVGEW